MKEQADSEGNATSEATKVTFAKSKDTRELLEADAIYFLYRVEDGDWVDKEMWELLDRQAAITEREYGQRFAYEIADEWMDAKDEEVRYLQAKAEQAERAMNEAAGKLAQADADKRELDKLNEYHKCQYEIACEDADRLREVVRTQVGTLRKLETELSEARRANESLTRQRDYLAKHMKAQREELARLNEQVHGKRKIPKKVKWPRFADGRMVKPGRDCSEVLMGEGGYSLWSDGKEEFGGAYGKPVPDSWRESEWR